MSRRSEQLYLEDMLNTSRWIERRVSEASRQELDTNEDLQLALTYQLQTLGEAAKNVSQLIKAAHSEIDWRRIEGLRHLIVHEYWRIDLQTLWEIATGDIPPLAAALVQIVPPEPP